MFYAFPVHSGERKVGKLQIRWLKTMFIKLCKVLMNKNNINHLSDYLHGSRIASIKRMQSNLHYKCAILKMSLNVHINFSQNQIHVITLFITRTSNIHNI